MQSELLTTKMYRNETWLYGMVENVLRNLRSFSTTSLTRHNKYLRIQYGKANVSKIIYSIKEDVI
jgi:hypothetical protein